MLVNFWLMVIICIFIYIIWKSFIYLYKFRLVVRHFKLVRGLKTLSFEGWLSGLLVFYSLALTHLLKGTLLWKLLIHFNLLLFSKKLLSGILWIFVIVSIIIGFVRLLLSLIFFDSILDLLLQFKIGNLAYTVTTIGSFAKYWQTVLSLDTKSIECSSWISRQQNITATSFLRSL